MAKVKKMKTLHLNDEIKMGEYAGVTLGTCLALYGRKSLLKVLKYYDIPKELLKANHYHKVGDEEPIEEEMHSNDSIMEKETIDMTPTIDVDELFEGYEEWVMDGMWETSTTNATYEYEDEDYEDDLWGMDWRRCPYEDDFMEMEWNGYKPWIYGE